PSPEAAKSMGAALLKAYTFEAVHPNPPDHVWLDEGNGRVQFFMFDKPVTDPSARLLFVGQGIKGRFCAESQPDGGKSGFNHFHRLNTPATGDTSMHGAKGEEGYWLKHVAVSEFELDPQEEHGGHGGSTHFKPGMVEHFPQPPAPKCG
ncbi:MAG TPA: hypothetical protein VFS39_05630, partial [Nitrospira sp.]|nr:hypothetical protein [Nitrospira sp.]